MVPQHDLAKLIAWAFHHRLALFPVPAWQKQPVGIITSHSKEWSKDPAQWQRWYDQTNGCNYGVEMGPSNLIAVDPDKGGWHDWNQWCLKNGFAMPFETVRTPNHGSHYYFRVITDADSHSMRQPNISPLVNVRAGNGYVIAPWSVTDTRSGDSGVKATGQYILGQESIDGPFYPAPQALLDLCAPAAEAHDQITPAEDYDLNDTDGFPKDQMLYAEVGRRVQAALEPLLQAMPGERNEKLNLTAFSLGKIVAEGKLTEWRARQLLEETGERIGIPRTEHKAQSTIRSGLRAAPRVGRPEPRSAMLQLLSQAVPLVTFPSLPPPDIPQDPETDIPPVPVVERLLYRGDVTVLSGEAGSGKTTFLASLMAASVADAKDFVGQGLNGSDIYAHPSAWIFVSYEGGQHIRRTTRAWYVGTECASAFPERAMHISLEDGNLVSTKDRQVGVNEPHLAQITAAIVEMRRRCPGLPVVLVIDNVTSAIENFMDSVQAQTFMRTAKMLAQRDVAVALIAHPPKTGNGVAGSFVFGALTDTNAYIEKLREEGGEWIQWVTFGKHRQAMNGDCLEVRSRRLSKPIVELPPDWGDGNERARQRQIRDLHLPFVSTIRIRPTSHRDALLNGVVSEVAGKPETMMKI